MTLMPSNCEEHPTCSVCRAQWRGETGWTTTTTDDDTELILCDACQLSTPADERLLVELFGEMADLSGAGY